MYKDRREAGQLLAALASERSFQHPVVFGLPRGGLPLASEVARQLKCPMSIVLVRKIGAPGQPELALGAVSEGDPPTIVRNEHVIASLGVDDASFDRLSRDQLAELKRRRRLYLGESMPLSATARDALLVDDGLATGATIRAAVKALRRQRPHEIGLLVPVAPREILDELGKIVDWVICPHPMESFSSVGECYERFPQVSDTEVIALLGRGVGHSAG
jgi:putative phosphoribosyl transferase